MKRLRDKTEDDVCCKEKAADIPIGLKKIALVGNPNVGKSVMFNNLTGIYAVVSNYPGTSVSVSRGKAEIGGEEFEVVDTPGMYSLLPLTEEEGVARRILLKERPFVVLHVIDAKNLDRMLVFTLQLIEAGLPTILVLNMMDEAERLGLDIDINGLERELGIPVVPTICTEGRGVDELKKRVKDYERGKTEIKYMEAPEYLKMETALQEIQALLKADYTLSKRMIGLLCLKGDKEILSLVAERDPEAVDRIKGIIDEAKRYYKRPFDYFSTMRRRNRIDELFSHNVKHTKKKGISFNERLSQITMNPVTGLPILFLVLYYGVYKFVGGFGAGTLVDFLEGVVFKQYINPFLSGIFSEIIPWPIIQSLFVGEYGVLTLGLRYSIAIILPIVSIFFIAFSIIEDSGYLPRLAMLIDRVFKSIGLSGRAVIPMVLGLGCDTMATLVTRTLPTKRERLISTVLLALAVPCSAQLGVILALLGENTTAMFIWTGTIVLVFMFIGFLTARIMPGEPPVFYMEVPPLRFPKPYNIVVKTYSRVKWYLMEILPVFIYASIFIWLGQVTGLFDVILKLLSKPVAVLGLPQEAARIFLFGFFRRDYGAAGLYDLNKSGLLTGVQLVVASIALTLFLPCIAQFLMNIKERGFKTGIGISVFVLFFSFLVAYAANLILNSLGVVI